MEGFDFLRRVFHHGKIHSDIPVSIAKPERAKGVYRFDVFTLFGRLIVSCVSRGTGRTRSDDMGCSQVRNGPLVEGGRTQYTQAQVI